jgi:Ca2+-binding EF-hand superfamily protein
MGGANGDDREMASEFQRSKVTVVFEAMDADEDGRLREADFVALAERWAGLRGPGDHARLRSIMLGWWSTLADAGGSEEVTVDDVLTVVDRLQTMPEAMNATAESMFEAVDQNGDGDISAPEYRQLIEAWSGRPTDTAEVFGLLDLDGDGFLSSTEFTAHWAEFWAGDDPQAPGSSVFGRIG